MSNPAQEEADRLFSDKTRTETHPEDRDSSDDEKNSDLEDRHTSRRNLRSGRLRDDQSSNDDEEDDNTYDKTTATNSKASYTIPSATSYANTGPKGVIADAQSYHRSKRKEFINSRSKPLSSEPRLQHAGIERPSGSGLGEDDDEDDDGFMQQWREQRLAELKQQQQQAGSTTSTSVPTGTYGRLNPVDADGYLEAIDKSPPDAVVVVFLYDDSSPDSVEVGEELERLAYTWSQVHFVKLPFEIAEMQTMDVPAILAYKAGEVFATISGAQREGLEDLLRQQGVLPLR